MGLELDGVNGIIKNTTSDGDVTIKGNDGGSEISALVFDMSAEGAATFNSSVTLKDAGGGAGAILNLTSADTSGASGEFLGIINFVSSDSSTGSAGTQAAIKGVYEDNGDSSGLEFFTGNSTGSGTPTLQKRMQMFHDSGVTITTPDNSDTLTLISTDTDAAAGPNLHLYRNQGTDEGDDDVLGQIKFSGRNDNAQDVLFYRQDVQSSDVSDGAEDGQVRHLIMVNGSETEFLRMNPTGFIFNEGSADLDFRVESNGNTHMLFVDGGNNRVGIGTTPDLGAGLHIRTADSGGSANANADELILEGAGSGAGVGMGILSATDGFGYIVFGDSGGNAQGGIQYHNNGDSMRIYTNDSEKLRISDGGKVGILETAPDVTDGGLCINQGASDNNILSLKSSDIAHARTSVAETDTYAEFHKAGINDGGLQITTLNDAGNIAFYLDAHARSVDTGKGTGDHGIMNFDANTHDGSNSGTSLTSNGNMVTFSNDNSVRFIFDAEGDIHVDGSSSISTYDAYEDAQLIRAYDLSHGAGVIASQFDKFVQYNKDDLTDAGLVGRVNHETLKDGTEAKPLINMTGFVRLHNGAIWQQYEKHQKLASAFYKLAEKTIGKEEADKLLTEEEIQLLN